ncbi:hypothetical protein OsI_34531 [Oryza sativa Indica Group]|uniref:aldehyde oxygenase (deformylating) n=1 Tax=Oryza sativa subsp. indica TaxID=39946 RepID=A2Z9W9_ORYSI|nr:hypothetical protein OsI_34531 [Oryza sativa Indica Group]
MLPYATAAEAEAALGRAMTAAESLWFRYSAGIPDYVLFWHNILFLFVVFTLAPLPVALLELRAPAAVGPFKLQPKVRLSREEFFRCYRDVMRLFFLVIGPLQLVSYPTVKMVGIHTGLPLPSLGEMAAQLLVYFLVEDYLNYWIHRLLHGEWGYEKIHRVHHEFTAPIGFAAPYAHWAEVLILGIPSFVGPALAPGHMITFWLWIVLRQMEAIETHSGFDFPFNLTKYIPFYGGAEYHDYHHYVGRQSQSNFASVFTYCDIYMEPTKYHKAYQAKMKALGQTEGEKADSNGLSYAKLD